MSFVHNIRAGNVNDALPSGLRILANMSARTEDSRNGPVRVMPGPVITIYDNPRERVLFSPIRDANPFFHLFESLWMLAGRNDLPILVQFNSKFGAYSDDGGATQPAAYGFRWRKYFGYDQLDAVVAELARDPNSRRAVLAMWDPGYSAEPRGGDPLEFARGDLTRAFDGSADIPCNTQCFFRVIDGCLDMSVMCRSNDIVWGAYGANAVHFSILQEYVAARLGLLVGRMYQYSFNYHYYENVVGNPAQAMKLAQDCDTHNYYETQALRPADMFADVMGFMNDLPAFMDTIDPAVDDVALLNNGRSPFTNVFLVGTAMPMWWAWQAHKRKEYPEAEAHCAKIVADDWRVACRMWVERRAFRHREKSA